jgi:enoyl-CoA hydratase
VRNPAAVTTTRDGGLATVRMGRAHGNAINDDLLDGLLEAFGEAERDPSVRGVILAASGKVFCPGLDLLELRALDRPTLRRFMTKLSRCFLTLFTFPKPVVAAISGHALAGGCVLALATDWRVLRWGALVGLNEIRVGLPLPLDVALVLKDSVSPHRLAEVALLGANYTDEAAVQVGLVHEVQQAEGFDAYCRTRLEEFAAKNTAAFGLTKRYLRAAVAERVEASGGAFVEEFLDVWFTEDSQRMIGKVVEDLERRKG